MQDFDAHAEALRRMARRLLQDADAAEDVLQESRLAIWKQPVRDPAGARSWYFAVVRNQSMIARRRRAAARSKEEHGSAPSEAADPAEECARLSAFEAIRSCVAALAEPYRSVVLLRHLEGLTVAEVAGILGRPEGTVRSQTKRGLALLRLRLRLQAQYPVGKRPPDEPRSGHKASA